ncbi:cyclic nucleotide-gated cation channel alpha-4-like [Dryobates pubescens]|uniref:cyclic nucleotide-gated cation channel alpha-4-like n=1 Tax=Dryobates pubescens TaxID=118200 RepID=UPI0023B9A277|nr:cyclic nucleotide-gated cation channel alpha-4-like [Dryobates pubescens]
MGNNTGTETGTGTGTGTGTKTGTGHNWCASFENWTLDPSGDWYCRWLILMALPVLYNWIILICRACFSEVQVAHAGLWRWLDGISDTLYLLDIGIRLHTAFLNEGLLVRARGRIWRRYLRSSLLPWDLASLLPTHLLHPSPLARANRCLRAPRLWEAAERWETRSGHPNAFRMAKLLLCLLAAIHWHSCLYFALSAHLGLGTDPWVCPNASRPLRRYLHSFYISTLVLATVGDTPVPGRQEEFLFLTFGFLLAVLGFATLAGSVSSVLSDLLAADAIFYPDPAPPRRYLRAQGAGTALARKVARWHQHLRAERKLPAELRVLSFLPRGLMAEVVAEVHLPALARVGIFQGWQEGVLRQLVLKLRPQVFMPGEFVCRRGDVGREMFFIRQGKLAVVAEDGITQLAVLGQGGYFGEISLISIKGNTSGNRRTANILSIGYSDLYCLSKEDLTEVLAEFPSARTMLEARGRQLLLAMGKLDLQAEAREVAAQEEAERWLQELEMALEGLQTRVARLVAQLEASALRMALRVQHLEGRIRCRQPGQGRGPGGAAGPGWRQGPGGGQGAGGSPTRAQGPPTTQGPTQAQGPPGAQGPPTTQDLGVPVGEGQAPGSEGHHGNN